MTVEVEPAGPEVPTESSVRVEVDESGVATVLIDQPGKKVNTMSLEFLADFERALDELQARHRGEQPIQGLILASGKDGQFVAGADLDQLPHASRPEEVEHTVRRMQRAVERLAGLPYPSVAAINGPALGGGLELALACDYRVAAESDKATLGSPEVQLGLLPAAGACQRLPRLVGLSRALGLILEGRRYTPRQAKRHGVVDEVVHPAVLVEAAGGWLRKGKRTGHPTWSRLDRAAERSPLVRSLIYRQAQRGVLAKTHGHYPAPLKALEAVEAGLEQGVGAGLAAEAVAFGALATGPVARNLIALFHATEELKREQRGLAPRALAVDRVGVVGSGFMGSGIAQAVAVAGNTVRLRDVEPKQVARGLKSVHELTMGAARKRRFSRREAKEIVSKVSGTTDYSGFRRAQLVIEAVFEDVAVKRGVIAELEAVLAPEAVIASNTSSLPIGSLAAEARHPERIVGMHFFSPVHKMPLLEVIRAERTSEQALATAVEVGRTMGKTVIVVNDCPGFYTVRTLGAMGQEARHLFDEGASIEDVDRALTRFGFPVGPFSLSDEVGIDVSAHVSQVLSDAYGERFAPSGSVGSMVDAGWLGRKTKLGFYDYHGRKKRVNRAVYDLREAPPQRFPADLIQRRLVLAFLNEAGRCLEEGVIACARDGDVGAIMGVAFPPFLGGPFRYADGLGLKSVVEQLRQMEYAYGARFACAPLLVRMAQEGREFYS